MNMTKQTAISLAMAAGGLFTVAVSADTLIDFTDGGQWVSAPSSNVTSVSPRNSFSPYPQVGTVTLESLNGGSLVFGRADATNTDGIPLALDNDGVGIRDDEVTLLSNNDVLGIKFANATTVTGVHFLDLYTGDPKNPAGSGPSGTGDQYAHESITVRFFSGTDYTGFLTDQSFTSDDLTLNRPAYNGYLFAAVNVANVASMQVFMTPRWTGTDDGNNDAAVAGVSIVPIPAAVWLFGSALVGMVGMGRRKLRNA